MEEVASYRHSGGATKKRTTSYRGQDVSTNPDALRVEIEAHWREDVPLLRDYLQDPAVADEAEWAFRAVGSMFNLVLAVDPEEFTAGAEELASAQPVDVTGDDAAGLLRAQVLLMAVLEAAEQHRPRSPPSWPNWPTTRRRWRRWPDSG